MLAVWWLAATVLSKGDGAFGRTEGQPTMLQDDAEAAVAPAASRSERDASDDWCKQARAPCPARAARRALVAVVFVLAVVGAAAGRRRAS